MAPPRRLTSMSIALAAAAAVFAVTLLVLEGQRGAEPGVANAAGRPGPDQIITEAEQRVAADPRFAPGLTKLAEGYFARAGATGNPAWLTKAEDAGRRAVRADPEAFEAMDALASIAASRHRFREALMWTQRSLAVAPTRVAPLSIRTDALIELGRYDEGFKLAQTRLDLRPDLPSYSRASYVRELIGDRAGAVRLMELAIDAAAQNSDSRATARAQLGLVLLAGGDLAGAERQVRTALAEVPGDTNATFVLARVSAARGDLEEAAELFSQVAAELPEPDHLAALAEVERALGRTEAAERHEAAMRAAFDLLEANGQDVDLDAALLTVDLRRPTTADVARARRGQAARPGIAGDQALGWVLTRAGRCAEGDRYASRSLRLGTQDPLMLFHAGMAAACAGRPAVARDRLTAALELNPAFSVRWAPIARKELARLPR
ncbi:tetratricopeptide repeat protein [Miltoncostaea oceani]|uniref:tetratricopeptide repeat protein n=1 Tax=Miltoncostaea oceani TaxID=2843216 RepID=UPI001C3D070E|nr:tetratricopeptide repeat protein [Miltoncostaea oceani]